MRSVEGKRKTKRASKRIFPTVAEIAEEVARLNLGKGWEAISDMIAKYAHIDKKIPAGYTIGKNVEVKTKSVGRNVVRWRRGKILKLRASQGRIEAVVAYIDGVKTTKAFAVGGQRLRIAS
ncbi:hypothetical protein AAMO2058_000567600 [Amorphochlora amoebiformis]